MFPDSSALAVQREARDQKSLTLLRADPASGATNELLSEHSDTWVELHDNLTFLYESRQLIWASNRSGFQHLYLYDWNGHLIRPLTQGDWLVTGDNDTHGMRGVDEDRGLVYFMANAESPLERHLYSVSFTDASVPMQKITTDAGWHAIAMSADTRTFLDTFSTPDQPPSLTLRSVTGESVQSSFPTRSHPSIRTRLTNRSNFRRNSAHCRRKTGRRCTIRSSSREISSPGAATPSSSMCTVVRATNVSGKPGEAIRAATRGFFRQFLAQNGYIVFTLDNRGSGSRAFDLNQRCITTWDQSKLRIR